MDWAKLRALIDAGDTDGVVRATTGLDERQRRQLGGPVKKYANWLRRDQADPNSAYHRDPISGQKQRNAAAVGCAACLPTAAALAPELTRHSLFCFDHVLDIEDACDLPVQASAVLRARDVPWLPDLARRLAERLPTGAGSRVGAARGVWRVAAGLARATGMAPPLTDGFVLCWAAGFRWRHSEQVADLMRRDPWLPVLVPRLFELDAGVPYPALAMLAADGTLDTEMLVKGCLAGLRRAGSPGVLEGFRALLDALDPGGQALDADRIRDYLALLPAGHHIAVETGQRELRCLDEAGRLEFGTLLEISEIVLRRREGKLVRAQLDWLDAAAGRDPSRAGEVLRAVAVAFDQQSGELQRRALTVAIRHAPHAGEAGRAELAGAATVLRADLRDRAAKAFGTAGVQATGPDAVGPALAGAGAGPVTVTAPPVRELPPPIGSAAELAGELAALYADCSEIRSGGVDPVMAERVLAALVGFAYQDRAALHEALRPVLTRYKITPGPRDWDQIARRLTPQWLRRAPEPPEGFADLTTAGTGGSVVELAELGSITGAAVAAPVGTPGSGYPAARRVKGELYWRYIVAAARVGGPRQAFLLRLHEIAVGLTHAPRPLLVATPTTASGLLDPGELLARLERAAAEGWQPWPCDLEQALLRLPRDTDGTIAGRARRLGTEAGAWLAGWLDEGGLPDPTVTRVRRIWDNGAWRAGVEGGVEHLLATIRPARTGPAARAAQAVRTAMGAPPRALTALLATLDHPERQVYGPYGQVSDYFKTAWLACWPATLPAHRDVIAAHLVPLLARRTMSRSAISSFHEPAAHLMLPLVAGADGPAGTGMHLALCYGLNARELSDRASAVDALLILAGHGQLDGAALGAELAALAAAGDVLLSRAVPALADAARAGAYPQVWDVVAAALPRLFPPAMPKPPQRLADLISLGAEAAEIIRPNGTVPGLAEVAGRGGSARFVTESRRLLRILGTGAG